MPPVMPDADIQAALAALPGWTYQSQDPCLARDWQFADFVQAFGFVTQVGHFNSQVIFGQATMFSSWAQSAGLSLASHRCSKVRSTATGWSLEHRVVDVLLISFQQLVSDVERLTASKSCCRIERESLIGVGEIIIKRQTNFFSTDSAYALTSHHI